MFFMKLRLCLKKSYRNFKIFKFQFLAFSHNIFPPPLIKLKKKLLVDKGKLPQLRQVMIISDIIVKMREKLHVLKNS